MNRSYPAMFRRLTLDEVVDHVGFEFGLDREAIVGRGERTYPRQARLAVAWLARRHTRADHRQVAVALGRSYAAACKFPGAAEELRAASADYRALVDRIDAMLAPLGEELAPVRSAVPAGRTAADLPPDVARLVRAARGIFGAVAMPFVAERIALEEALGAFADSVEAAA